MKYSCEERKNTPKEGVKMIDIIVDQGDSIPLKKDWSKRSCTLTACFEKYMDRTLNFEVREDDVWIITFPKCGTTWMQEASWLIQNDFDFEKALNTQLNDRSIYVEIKGIYDDDRADTYTKADNMPSPRLLKTHLPASVLPIQIWTKKPKIIYVARNAKDAAISFYHFAESRRVFTGTKEQLVEAFMKDNLFYSPFWPHILEFWQMRDQPNIFFTSYEHMKTDLKKIVKDLCVFLEKPVPNEEILDKAVKHLSFDVMKDRVNASKNHNKNPNSNFKFMRRGIVGSYKDELPSELIKELDSWSGEYLKEAGTSNEELFGLNLN